MFQAFADFNRLAKTVSTRCCWATPQRTELHQGVPSFKSSRIFPCTIYVISILRNTEPTNSALPLLILYFDVINTCSFRIEKIGILAPSLGGDVRNCVSVLACPSFQFVIGSFKFENNQGKDKNQHKTGKYFRSVISENHPFISRFRTNTLLTSYKSCLYRLPVTYIRYLLPIWVTFLGSLYR